MKFHRDINLPEQALRFARRGVIKLAYTHHARLSLCRHRNCVVPELTTLDTNAADVIEVEFDEGRYHKTLYRVKNSPEKGLDTVLAVMYNGVVKTTWVNRSDDEHSTLRREEYEF